MLARLALAFSPGRRLADVATISLLHERNMRHSDSLNDQLQTALNSGVVIEQAEGELAERLGLDMDQAFKLLRDHARAESRRPPPGQDPGPAASIRYRTVSRDAALRASWAPAMIAAVRLSSSGSPGKLAAGSG